MPKKSIVCIAKRVFIVLCLSNIYLSCGSSIENKTDNPANPVPGGTAGSNVPPDRAPAEDEPALAANGVTGLMRGVSPYIVVDQFGYLPRAEKIAVIRDPQVGFDAKEVFNPASTYFLIDAYSGKEVHQGSLQLWKGGKVSDTAGDKVWWYDFSSVTKPGSYYVLDKQNRTRSDVFKIAENVYSQVLTQAVRSFFYQRAGMAKEARFAGRGWADGASHLGPLQDRQCRRFNALSDPATEKDLQGGWYDAGDFNRYTSWEAIAVMGLINAYLTAPQAFGDDSGIPESFNAIPDVLDEAKWGLDFLVRMQNGDGSVLSIVGVDQASPPSSAKGPSKYGPANTSATLNAAAAYALGAKVFAQQNSSAMKAYSKDLLARAKKAYGWAEAHPNVIFKNNDSTNGSGGLGGGQQETGDEGRMLAKIHAATYLYAVTNDRKYKDYFEANYHKTGFIGSGRVIPEEQDEQEILLYFTTLPQVSAEVKNRIRTAYQNQMRAAHNFGVHENNDDAYLAFLPSYYWSSNKIKAAKGLTYTQFKRYEIDRSKNELADRAAQRYLHYLHGVNPLGLVYLSNMYAYGASKSVNELYHFWFADGSGKWDRVGQSTYGPPPGFLTGGPNQYYAPDKCCNNLSCGEQGNRLCKSERDALPVGQPGQKSYRDFNAGWPLNSWQLSENAIGYQVRYIKLLAQYSAR
jgi:hypothetical protein